MKDGWWWNSYTQSHATWQPYGCYMASYSGKAVKQCFPSASLHIVGDSNMRKLYYSLAQRLDQNLVIDEHTKPHENLMTLFQPEQLRGPALHFLWDPYLNATKWSEVLSTDTAPPSLLLISAGSWFIKNLPVETALVLFKQSMNTLASAIENMGNSTMDIIFLPISPVVPEKLDITRAALNNDVIVQYNEVVESLVELLQHSIQGPQRILYHRSWYKIFQDAPSLSEDGLHYDNVAYRVGGDVTLNVHCNRALLNEGNPMTATCNTRYRDVQWKQITVFAVLALLGPVCLLIHHGTCA